MLFNYCKKNFLSQRSQNARTSSTTTATVFLKGGKKGRRKKKYTQEFPSSFRKAGKAMRAGEKLTSLICVSTDMTGHIRKTGERERECMLMLIEILVSRISTETKGWAEQTKQLDLCVTRVKEKEQETKKKV
jgi:hypothetical protein